MATRPGTSIICDVCGFDMGDSLTDSGRCLGCGTPLGPSSDHSAHAPGFEVRDDSHAGRDSPYVVDEQDRERYPELEGVTAIRRLEFEFGRGIGAEPYGYHTRHYVAVVDLDEWANKERGRARLDDVPDECPECGHDAGLYGFHQDAAGICGSITVACLVCEAVLAKERWD